MIKYNIDTLYYNSINWENDDIMESNVNDIFFQTLKISQLNIDQDHHMQKNDFLWDQSLQKS